MPLTLGMRRARPYRPLNGLINSLQIAELGASTLQMSFHSGYNCVRNWFIPTRIGWPSQLDTEKNDSCDQKCGPDEARDIDRVTFETKYSIVVEDQRGEHLPGDQ